MTALMASWPGVEKLRSAPHDRHACDEGYAVVRDIHHGEIAIILGASTWHLDWSRESELGDSTRTQVMQDAFI